MSAIVFSTAKVLIHAVYTISVRNFLKMSTSLVACDVSI